MHAASCSSSKFCGSLQVISPIPAAWRPSAIAVPIRPAPPIWTRAARSPSFFGFTVGTPHLHEFRSGTERRRVIDRLLYIWTMAAGGQRALAQNDAVVQQAGVVEPERI